VVTKSPEKIEDNAEKQGNGKKKTDEEKGTELSVGKGGVVSIRGKGVKHGPKNGGKKHARGGQSKRKRNGSKRPNFQCVAERNPQRGAPAAERRGGNGRCHKEGDGKRQGEPRKPWGRQGTICLHAGTKKGQGQKGKKKELPRSKAPWKKKKNAAGGGGIKLHQG